MLVAAEEGIIQRGHAQAGEKTMLDALQPAALAAQRSMAEGADLAAVLQLAADAAVQGAESTKEMIAKIGRASRLGERSRGHQDPGATSLSLILQVAAETLHALELADRSVG
jgi:dihydroxyacetone kinase-like protein